MAGSPSTEPAPRAASARRASLSRLRGIERSVRFSLGDPERTMPALDRPRRAKNNNENSKFSPDPPRTVKKTTKKKAVPKQAMARKPRVSTNAAHVQQRSARPESAHPSDHSDHPLWYLADLAAEIPGGVGSPQTRDGGKPRTREIADECDHHERVQLTREAIALEVSRLDDLRRARLGLKELRERGLSRVSGEGVRAEELLESVTRLEEAWRAFVARNEVRWSDQLRRDGESQVEARRRQRVTEARVARLEELASSLVRERAAAAQSSPVTPVTGTRATIPLFATTEGRRDAPVSRTPPWKG